MRVEWSKVTTRKVEVEETKTKWRVVGWWKGTLGSCRPAPKVEQAKSTLTVVKVNKLLGMTHKTLKIFCQKCYMFVVCTLCQSYMFMIQKLLWMLKGDSQWNGVLYWLLDTIQYFYFYFPINFIDHQFI